MANPFHKNYIILGGIGALFFFLTSYLYFSSGFLFNSPDETLTYFFSQNWIEQSSFKVTEDLSAVSGNRVHPRSSLVHEGDIVPNGFLGQFLFLGILGKIIGTNLILFVIPFISAIVPLLLYWILKQIFSDKIAFLSAVFLYLHPAFIYYTSRNFLPNVLFVDLLLIGLFFIFRLKLFQKGSYKNYLYTVLGSFFIAMSLWVRLSEFWWVLILTISCLVFIHKKISWKNYFLGIFVFMLCFMPLLYLNNDLYGSPLSTGYSMFKQEVNDTVSVIEGEPALQSSALKLFFPFGNNLTDSALNFYKYGIYLFAWYFILSVIGSILFWKKENKTKQQKLYSLVFIVVSLYLVIFYGSWEIVDNINAGNITIGNSYVRYWLPMYILGLPYVAFCVLKIAQKSKFVLWAVVFIFAFMSLFVSYFGSQESVWDIAKNIKQYQRIQDLVLTYVPEEGVIVVERSDKIFFPKRKVMVAPERNYADAVYGIMGILDAGTSVFLYTQMGGDDTDYLQRTIFEEKGIKLRKITETTGHFLYEFYKK